MTSPTVEFFSVEAGSELDQARFICKLVGELVRHDQPIHILTATEHMTRTLDEALWHYPADRFLPHTIMTKSSPTCLITMNMAMEKDSGCESVINLSATVPNSLDGILQICELVGIDSNDKRDARNKFRDYQKRGLHPKHSTIDDWETRSILS